MILPLIIKCHTYRGKYQITTFIFFLPITAAQPETLIPLGFNFHWNVQNTENSRVHFLCTLLADIRLLSPYCPNLSYTGEWTWQLEPKRNTLNIFDILKVCGLTYSTYHRNKLIDTLIYCAYFLSVIMYLICTSGCCVCQEIVSTAPCMHHEVEVVKDGNMVKHMEASCTLQATLDAKHLA